MDAMFFRQVEKSTETNLLDDLSKSLETGQNLLADDDNLKNLLLMNDDNPLNDEDDDMLLTSGNQENGVFSLLEDPLADLSSTNPIMITPRNDGQHINLQAQAEISDKNYFTPNARINNESSDGADMMLGVHEYGGANT